MTPSAITSHRLIHQHLSGSPFHKPADVVSYMGAMQAQDYLGSLWAIALRTKKSTEADIEKAIADKTIVRTWPMRGTLHFTSSENVRWMLEYLTPRPIARAATQHRKEGLTGNEFKKSRQVLEQEMRDGHLLTRDEMYATLEKKRYPVRDNEVCTSLYNWPRKDSSVSPHARESNTLSHCWKNGFRNAT